MVQRRPTSLLAGTCLGAAIAVTMFATEVVARGAPWSGWGAALVITLGFGAGGAFGALTAKIGRWPVLAAAVLGPTFLFALHELNWALRRAFELTILKRPQLMFNAVHILGVVTISLVGIALVIGALKRLPQPAKRPLYKVLTAVGVFVVTLFGAMPMLEMDALDLGTWLVFGWVAAVGATLAFDRWVNGLAVVGLLGSLGALYLLPMRYQVLLSTFTAWAFGFILLLARYNFDKVLTRGEGRRRAWAAGLGVVLALFVSERITAIHPTAWRIRPAAGALSGALYSLRSATDFDGDGHSLVFGMRDCAPFDASIGPHQHETVDNGVDDNCVAGSAVRREPSFFRSVDKLQPRPAAAAKGRDLILYVVDALRYDDTVDLRLDGFAPFLDESVVYDRAYTTATYTSQAMMGHLAGRLPSTETMFVVHRLNSYPSPAPKGLAHFLAENGYDTGLAGGMACDEGTDCMDSAYFTPLSHGEGFRVLSLVPRGGDTADVLKLARRGWAELDPEKPRFLWIHDLSVHDAETNREAYREKVRAASETFATLRDEIAPDALWVLTSDHGEEFLEHGDYRHARTLYEEVLQVPLAIRIPGGKPTRIPNVCSLRSLMPTLVSLLGVHLGPDGLGPYLCLTPDGCTDQPAPAALELIDIHLHALVLGNRKIIRDIGQGVLFSFDLAADPGEQHPSFYPPADLEAALVEWEEQAFGNTDDTSVWPYRAPRER